MPVEGVLADYSWVDIGRARSPLADSDLNRALPGRALASICHSMSQLLEKLRLTRRIYMLDEGALYAYSLYLDLLIKTMILY